MSNSCANCSFFVSASCRINPPLVRDGSDYSWPKVQANDWCAAWNCWPGNPVPTTPTPSCTSGTALPSGGVDGDFYVWYNLKTGGPPPLIDACKVYQRQAGNWVIIITII